MNKKIYIIFLVLVWFILNIFFYLLSDNYRYFLQSLKYDDITDYKVNDEFKIDILDLEKDVVKAPKDNLFSWLSDNFWEETKKIEKTITIKNSNDEKIVERKDFYEEPEEKSEFIDAREELKLTNIEKKILESFNWYDLKEVDLHPRLFDLTWEYPDEYFEYYAKDINLYFFWNKSYSDLVDIFTVLTYELPFSVNEVNNFWSKSFYINLDELFEDEYIRIVLEKSNRTFWLKIKKQLYEKIKNDLSVVFSK